MPTNSHPILEYVVHNNKIYRLKKCKVISVSGLKEYGQSDGGFGFTRTFILKAADGTVIRVVDFYSYPLIAGGWRGVLGVQDRRTYPYSGSASRVLTDPAEFTCEMRALGFALEAIAKMSGLKLV